MGAYQATGSTIRDRTVPAHILDGARLLPCAVVRAVERALRRTLGRQARWVIRTRWSGRWVVGTPTKDKLPQTLSP